MCNKTVSPSNSLLDSYLQNPQLACLKGGAHDKRCIARLGVLLRLPQQCDNVDECHIGFLNVWFKDDELKDKIEFADLCKQCPEKFKDQPFCEGVEN